MDRIDPEPLFDSSYFINLLSFSYPVDWARRWHSSSAAYRINAASFDCCELLLKQELKFRRSLIAGLDFKFRFISEENKDRQEVHHWLELEKTMGYGFSALVLGEPAFNKGDSDIGLCMGFYATFKASAARPWGGGNFRVLLLF